MSVDVARCPLRGKITPVENHCSVFVKLVSVGPAFSGIADHGENLCWRSDRYSRIPGGRGAATEASQAGGLKSPEDTRRYTGVSCCIRAGCCQLRGSWMGRHS